MTESSKSKRRLRMEDQLATVWSSSPDWDEDSVNEQLRDRGAEPRRKKPVRGGCLLESEYQVTLRLVATFSDEELSANLEYAMKQQIAAYLATIGPVGVIAALSTACFDMSAEHRATHENTMLLDHWIRLGKETAELHRKPYVVWINGQIEEAK